MPPQPPQDPAQTLQWLMEMFGGVPQESMLDPKGKYQDPMDPLNDSLDTAQNLYSTLGFNLQDLLLPPEAPEPWVNDIATQYGGSPLYADIFSDIENGVDPLTAVGNVISSAFPVDAQGNPVDPTKPGNASKIARYVVQRPDGSVMDLPTKIWNQTNNVTGTSIPTPQLDLEAIQGVAKDYASSMAEGRRQEALAPDYGVYTALDEMGGREGVEARKLAYGMRSQMESVGEAERINKMIQDNRSRGADTGPPTRMIYPKGMDTLSMALENEEAQANPTWGESGVVPASRRVDMSSLQGMGAGARGVEVPDFGALVSAIGRGSTPPEGPTKRATNNAVQRDRRNERQKANAGHRTKSYQETLDRLASKNGGRVARVGKDRQRQLDALTVALSLPQILNGG